MCFYLQYKKNTVTARTTITREQLWLVLLPFRPGPLFILRYVHGFGNRSFELYSINLFLYLPSLKIDQKHNFLLRERQTFSSEKNIRAISKSMHKFQDSYIEMICSYHSEILTLLRKND